MVIDCLDNKVILILRYFDWNKETITLTGDRVNKVCNSPYNYIPLYYIFGSVGECMQAYLSSLPRLLMSIIPTVKILR